MNLAAIPEPRKRRKRGQTAPKAAGKAAIYTRVSTDEQTEDRSGNGGSLHSQEEACRALCRAREFNVAHVFSDQGKSGGNLDRPALSALRRAVERGEVGVVVVYALDRLSRRQADTLALLEEFEEQGAGLVAASQSFDTTSPAGRAMLGMLAVFAELQREEIRERTRVALARKRERGEAVHRTPFGLARDGKVFVRDPASWPIIERVLSERSKGRTCAQIAAGLNADRVRTPTAKGTWHPSGVSRVCRSAAIRAAAEMQAAAIQRPGESPNEFFRRSEAERRGR